MSSDPQSESALSSTMFSNLRCRDSLRTHIDRLEITLQVNTRSVRINRELLSDLCYRKFGAYAPCRKFSRSILCSLHFCSKYFTTFNDSFFSNYLDGWSIIFFLLSKSHKTTEFKIETLSICQRKVLTPELPKRPKCNICKESTFY